MKPGATLGSMVPLKSTHLLDQVRERIRYLHWVKFYVRWHGRNGAMRHPRDMGAPDVEAF
jgi:hypothetical protein